MQVISQVPYYPGGPTFDASLWELVLTLGWQGCLVIAADASTTDGVARVLARGPGDVLALLELALVDPDQREPSQEGARGEGRQQTDIRFAEGVVVVQVLERDHARRLAARTERHVEHRLRHLT